MSDRIQEVGVEILVDPERVHPFKGQPRRYFNEASIKALAKSIETSGQKQPATVRVISGEGEEREFELIDGERRWRACLMIGKPLNAVIRVETERKHQFLSAAVANFLKEPHTPLEIAHALLEIKMDFNLTFQNSAITLECLLVGHKGI